MVLTSRARCLAIATLVGACGNVGAPDPDPTIGESSHVAAVPPGHMLGGYARIDLVSDQAGVAPRVDPDLVNAWGITTGEGGFWIADDDNGKVSIYDGNGAPTQGEYTSGAIQLGADITGVVRNDDVDLFQIHTGTDCGPAEFIFARQDGQLLGVNGDLSTTRGFPLVNQPGAVFTGVTIAGQRLLAADLDGKKIDVYDASFQPARGLAADAFVDPCLPAAYGPFNVMALGGHVFVAYAAVDPATGDEEHGAGLGIVSEFDFDGHFVRRIATAGTLNAPWGMAIAPASFGHGGALLVGNFGDGRIGAYNIDTGAAQGLLEDTHGSPLVVDGLWGITFGDGEDAGATNILYFAAGPDDETHGLFGRIVRSAQCD